MLNNEKNRINTEIVYFFSLRNKKFTFKKRLFIRVVNFFSRNNTKKFLSL